jgi:hypothetical protein
MSSILLACIGTKVQFAVCGQNSDALQSTALKVSTFGFKKMHKQCKKETQEQVMSMELKTETK